MQFGICVMADIDAESLGYDSVWVTDSQMIFSDCYAVLALAARQTHRIRLGPGTAICGTRIPPVHVAAMATLNRLAPGRCTWASAPATRRWARWASDPCVSRSTTSTCACWPLCCAARRWTIATTTAFVPSRPRAEDPALRLGLRPARDGAGRHARRRARLRHPAPRRRRRRRARPRTPGSRPRGPSARRLP